MAQHSKHDKFHLSFAVIIRLVIFFIIAYFFITYFSTRQSPSVVLGDHIELKPVVDNLIQKLPPASQQQINNFSSNPAIKFINSKIDQLKIETNDFPQKQLTDIKKAVINQIYQNVMKSVDNPAK